MKKNKIYIISVVDRSHAVLRLFDLSPVDSYGISNY